MSIKNETHDYASSFSTDFMTVKDVATVLQISEHQSYKLFNSEGFPAIKIGHIFRIEKSRFKKWCDDYAGRSFLIGK